MMKSKSAQLYDDLKRRALARPIEFIDPQKPLWIFGAGHFGRDLAHIVQASNYNLRGFVETNPKTSSVIGLPVLDWTTLAESHSDAQIALGIFNRETPFDQLCSIASYAGFHNLIMPYDLMHQFGNELGWRFWLKSSHALANDIPAIEIFSEYLADEESRALLYRITAFRLGLDRAFASYRSNDAQYFNDLTLPHLRSRKITYIDCGAYNGDTFRALSHAPDIAIERAILLEPDSQNYSELIKTVEADPTVMCLPLAVSDTYKIISFAGGNGEGGRIVEDGTDHIAAVALDALCPNMKIDFIKLDIEGAEASALAGAKQIINKWRPLLTLSLYHHPHDLWVLPQLIRQFCDDYQFYIRQHFYNSFELVLYGIPNGHSHHAA